VPTPARAIAASMVAIRSSAVARLSLDFSAMRSLHRRRRDVGTIDGAPRMPIAAGRNVANGAPVLPPNCVRELSHTVP